MLEPRPVIGWVSGQSNPTGRLTISAGGLTTQGLLVGHASNGNPDPIASVGVADISGGVTAMVTGFDHVRVGVANNNVNTSTATNGHLIVRTGDLLTRSLTVGNAQATGGASDTNATAIATGNVQVLSGDIGSAASPLTAFEIGNIWLANRSGSETVGSVNVAGDLHFDSTGGSVVLATSAMWADPTNPGFQPRRAEGTLTVGGTAHIRGGGLLVGAGVGYDAEFVGVVDIANADLAVNETRIGVGAGRDHTVSGTVILRDGVASLGEIQIATLSGTPNNVTAQGLLALGSVTTATQLALGDGATLQFLLRDDPAESGSLAVNGISGLDGELAIDVVEPLSWEIGDTYKILDTLPGGAGFGGSTFDNVANGGLLASLDGGYLFSVHYGAGSIYDASDVVIRLEQIVPEPAAATLLAILSGAAMLRRRGR